jgi:hypothetical protein
MNHTPWVIYSLITGYKNAQQFLMLKSDHRKTLEITSLYGSYFFLEMLCILITTMYMSLMYGEAAI